MGKIYGTPWTYIAFQLALALDIIWEYNEYTSLRACFTRLSGTDITINANQKLRSNIGSTHHGHLGNLCHSVLKSVHELQRNPRYIQDQYRPFCRKGLKVLDLNEIVKWEKMSHINCVNRGSSTRLISIVAVLFLVENCGDNVIWTSWHKPSLRQQQYCFRIETHR